MKSTYLTLVEANISRYTRGGALVGDYIKLVDGWEKSEEGKKLGTGVVDFLKSLVQSGLHLRISNIKNVMPSRAPGYEDNMNGDVVFDIVADEGGGRYSQSATVSPSLVKIVTTKDNNYPSVPDGQVRDSKIILKPQPIKSEDNEELQRRTKGEDKETRKWKELGNKNVKIPSVTVKGAKSPAVDSYTINYLKDLH